MLELVCAIRVDLCSFGDVVGVDRNICVDAGCILARRDDFDVCVCVHVSKSWLESCVTTMGAESGKPSESALHLSRCAV